MKKYLAPIGTAITFLLLRSQAFAQVAIDPCTSSGSLSANNALSKLCGSKNLGIGSVIGFVVTIGFVAAVIIALFFLIYGGIKWITSGGDKGGVEAARNQIIAAVIGLIIVFLSFFILNLVLQFFGLSLFTLVLPQLL